MILVDVNLLLYAYDAASPHHATAKRWLERVLSEEPAVRFAWLTILAFLRIATDPRISPRPMTLSEATERVSEWLGLENVAILPAGDRHWEILTRLLASARSRGPLVMDGHLAALAVEHGATLCTADRDFLRFRGIRLEFPLEA